MATYLISINPGDTLEQITLGTGPGITSKFIELQVDLGNNVTDGNAASPRQIKRGEIHEALNKIVQQVIKDPKFVD